VFAVQLALLAGARVIGTGSATSSDYLRDLGAEPVTYGDGLADRVRGLALGGVTAAIDLHGTETVHVARELGVPDERITTIAAQVDGVTPATVPTPPPALWRKSRAWSQLVACVRMDDLVRVDHRDQRVQHSVLGGHPLSEQVHPSPQRFARRKAGDGLRRTCGEPPHLILIDRTDQRLARREVAVERRDPTPASRARARIDGSVFDRANTSVATRSSASRLRAASARCLGAFRSGAEVIRRLQSPGVRHYRRLKRNAIRLPFEHG
jgi:hypothetical protein